MKKILSVLMALIMALSAVQCLSVVSFAADESETAVAEDHGEVVKSGNCGEKDENGDFSSNVTYELYEDGTLVISGNGAMPDFSYDEWVYEEIDNPYASYIVSEEYDYYIDRTIKAVKVEEGVTKIGANAFVSFVNLASVELPESITGIGTSAFYQCHAIESINIPDSVTYIKESAFAGCSGLKSLTIPKGVGSFGVGAFSGCTNLESVEFEGTTYISACCFFACNKLTTLILPATLKFIDSAFYNCNSLSDIYYYGTEEQWNSIRIVDQSNDALRNAAIHYNYNPCDHNNTTNCPEQSATCTEDGYTAGVYCADCETWLSGHELIKKHHTDADGDKLCDICGKEAKTVVKQGNCGPYNNETYDYNSNVTYTLYEDGQLVIGGSGAMADFYWNSEFPDTPYASYYFDEDDNVTDTTVKSVVIEDGVTHIGKNAFSGFAKLESAVIPDSVETIGELAFANSAIKEINALKNVRFIDSNAFVNCNGISAIIIDNPECELNQCGFPPLTEIHGYKYTPAYDYAVENGNPFVEIGEWKTLDSIGISSMPNKTTYKQGAPFRQTGLSVMAYFTDGTAIEKTKGFTVSGFDSSEIGTCTLTVTYEDKTTTFDVEIIEFVEPTINAGETINVEVEGGSLTFIKFVPTVTGTFTCTSVSYEDTYGYLYQTDKETLIMSDDDSGMNTNFSMTCDLEAGNTYYWAVRYYNTDQSGSFDVRLTCDQIACAHENKTEHDEQAATCTEDGYTAGIYCEDCGTWISGHELIKKHHTDADGDRICDICGKEAKVIVKSGNCGEFNEDTLMHDSNVTFILYDDGTLVVSGSGLFGYLYTDAGEVYSPYADYKYDSNDRIYNDFIKTVVIEDGVTNIGDNAFYAFRNLESVVIPDSVTNIRYRAFYDCRGLKEVNFTGSQEQWENISVDSNNSALYNAEICYDYVPCDHNTITNHPEQAETCTEDGYTAGIYCEDCGKWIFGHAVIKKHHTDKDADNICDLCGEAARIAVKSGNCGASIYDECDDIVGNEDNAQFVLYDDGTLVISGSGSLGGFGYGMDDELPSVPYASYSRWYDEEEDWETYYDDTVKSVIIEDGITAIGDYAFYCFRSLESVSIPDSVETINYYAFANSGIKEINLPASVQSVGSSVFSGCSNLSTITVNNPECDIFNSNIPYETEIHGYKYSTAYDCVLEHGNSFVQIGEAKELENISISSMPNKTTYKQGAPFRQDGLIVTLLFTDGTSVDKTRGFTVSGFDSSEIGSCTLTVTYEDKTATFDVEIIENKEYVINSGETIQVDVESDSMTYIKFVPTIDGTFTFTLYDEGEMPYAYLFDAEKNTLVYGYDSEPITYNFETGKTYYWGVSCCAVGCYPIDVNLTCDKVFCSHKNTTEHDEQAATCTEEGYTAGAFCEDCQTWASGHEIIFRHHTDVDNDGICDVCNKTAKAVVRSGYCGTYNRYNFDYNSNVVYILYDDGELVISGSGAMADFNWNSEFPDTPYASYMYDDMDMAIADMTVSSVVIENGVTRIGKNAFNAFKNLERIVIPESVTSIGYSAFYGCNSLREVNFTGTQEQWENISVESYNSWLLNADIYYNYVPCDHNNTTNHPEQPATCTENGYTAGTYCEDCGRWISGHKKIVKHHVDEDGDGICDVCKDEFKTVIKQGNCGAPIYDEDDEIVGYEDVNYDLYDNGLLVISGKGQMCDFYYYDSAPYADYQYDDNNRVYYDNTVKAVVIENGVTSVGDYAFSGFRSLSSVTIPESVTRIGGYAFSGCTALDNVNIPDSVGSIGEGALTKEISFEPATAYAFHEGVSDGYYDTDDDGESYYNYSHPDFENGDKLTVRNIDGTETEYTLKDGYFEAENADRIDAGDLWFRSNQYQNHWFPDGEYNYMTLKFGAAFCEVPVAVYDNPVESISVTLASPYVLMDRISSDETVHFRTGDVLTVNYTDKTSKEFVCKVDKYNDCTFTSSDGEKLNRVRINRDGDFSVGMNAATVNYAGKTCDFPVEVTQCTVESISASYRYTLYNGYDCQLDTCEEHDEWCSSEEYINDAYVLYTVNLTDGNVFTGTETEVYEEFGARPWTHIVLDRIGTNEGSVTLGDFIGVFTVNVEEKPSGEENLPTCYVNGFELSYAVGQKVDYQLIQFADKGYTHSVNVISIPDGLTLSQDGRLTGTVTGRNLLEFDVRWDDTYVHEHYIVTTYIYDASATVEIPEVDDLTEYDTRIYVEASESDPTWLKFRACNSGLWLCAFANDSYHRGYACEVYTENGVQVFPGAGDFDDYAMALYSLAIGEYYYIKVNFSGWIKLESPSWLPVWDEDDNLGGKIDYSLVETNVEKEFDGDSNTLWNVYKLEMPFHVDTNGGITYDIFGAMARFASPVNIHITSEATSNLEILNKKSYKFDPNSVEECEAIGASTEQDTLIDKLLPGEKEYRFDTVYYLMPEVADFDLVQTSLLYVPVGYALTDDDGIGRITESCTHGNTETVTENEVPATCKEGGSYDSVRYCKDCGVELSRETVTTPKKAHTESAWITDKASDCVNGGTKHTECTVCGEILQTADIPANGHSYESVVTAPTCTADGYTTHTCKVCGERYTDTIVDKLGHSFTSYVSNNDATCTADGTKTAKCDRCDVTDTVADTGSKKAHTETSIPAVSATCTEKGLTEGKKCSVCREILVAQKEIPAKGHSYESVVTAPTCTADGYTTHTCSVCGNAYTDSVVKAKGHTVKTAVTKATTTKNGKIVTTCAVCGESLGTTVIYKASSIKLSATKYTYDGKTKTPTVTVKDSKGNTLKKGTDYTVKYATGRKNTGKYTVTVTFNGNYTGSKTLSFNILPGKTSKLTATQTTSSVKATWKSVTGASGYKVTLYSAKNKAIKTVYTTKTSASFTKLSKGTTYKVKVTAYKTIDGKKVTSSVSTLLTTATKPGTPTLKATAGTKKATLSWNKQTGATGYVVYMATSKNGKYSKIATVKGGSKVSFTKTGLTKGKTYYFKVAAFETVGGKTIYGGYSAVKSVKVK